MVNPDSDGDGPGQQFRALRLRLKQQIARDIWLFEFEDSGHCALDPYTPGAHITVQTPSGSRRQYSLCGDGQHLDHYSIAIKSEPDGRGASLSMVENSEVGDMIRIGAPENSFVLDAADQYLFIAGGIGITPIISMLTKLKAEGHDGFQLIYCTRDRDGTAFFDQLADPFFDGKITIHHDQGDPDQIYDLWPHFEQPGKQIVYCCGPRPMMEEVRDMTGHWPASAIRFEDFGSDVEAVRADDRAFTVRHADTGEVIEIPADATILETLRRHGSGLRSSCESGTCGTCKVALIAGEADHRDIVLQPYEQDDQIMICVSRAISDQLVLRW